MQEIHNKVCENHSREGHVLKCLHQAYYWPTMDRDAKEFIQECIKCQQFANIIKSHSKKLTSIVNAWPFAKWALDLIVCRSDTAL